MYKRIYVGLLGNSIERPTLEEALVRQDLSRQPADRGRSGSLLLPGGTGLQSSDYTPRITRGSLR